MESIGDCIDTYTTSGGTDVVATALLFEITEPDNYLWSALTHTEVKVGNNIEGFEIGSAYISAEGISMPNNSMCLTIILPDESSVDPYTIMTQEIELMCFNRETEEELFKRYNLNIIIPETP